MISPAEVVICLSLRGREELIEEENLKVRIEIAEKFIEKGQMSLEDIADCASLPLEKVRELADKLQPQMA